MITIQLHIFYKESEFFQFSLEFQLDKSHSFSMPFSTAEWAAAGFNWILMLQKLGSCVSGKDIMKLFYLPDVYKLLIFLLTWTCMLVHKLHIVTLTA